MAIVQCFNCFKSIDKKEAIRDQNVFFCDWDCRDVFFEKLEKKEKEKDNET